jgi:hypothetical protein
MSRASACAAARDPRTTSRGALGASISGGRLSARLLIFTLTSTAPSDVLKALYPESEELASLSDETRVVVSEPLGALPGAWNEVPEPRLGIAQHTVDELRPFTPTRP